MPFGKFSKMVLIFALNGKPSSPNTARGKQQADLLPILTANRRDTPLEKQKRRQKTNDAEFQMKNLLYRVREELFFPYLRPV